MERLVYELGTALIIGLIAGLILGYVLKSRSLREKDSTPEKLARRVLRHLYKYPDTPKAEVCKTLLKAGLPAEMMAKMRQMTPEEMISSVERTACVVEGYTVRALFRTKSRPEAHEELWHWYNIGALPLKAGWLMIAENPDGVRALYAEPAN